MSKPAFLKDFMKIYIVLVLQNVVTLSVNLLDNLMIGSYSEIALSGVATVNQIQFVYQQILTALADGLIILCTQYYGKKNIKAMKQIQVFVMYFSIIVAILLFGIVTLFPESILSIFTNDTNVLKEASSYLSVIRFSYVFFAISMISVAMLKSISIVKIGFYLSIMTFCINGVLNYLLIYGSFGFPELGATGAALGTLIARICETCVCVWFLFFRDNKLKYILKDFFNFNFGLAHDYLKITVPMVLVQSSWGVSSALQTSILGHISTNAIAANSIATTLFLVTKSAAIGASSAASLFMGRLVGSGQENLTKKYGYKLQKVFLIIGILGGACLFLIRIPFLSLYQLSASTMDLANAFLIILSISFVGMSYQMPTNNGIIRGAGDSMFGVKLDFVSTWLIVIPVSAILAFVFKASPIIVMFFLNFDQLFKCIPVFLKMKSGNWIKKLTRE